MKNKSILILLCWFLFIACEEKSVNYDSQYAQDFTVLDQEQADLETEYQQDSSDLDMNADLDLAD